MRHMWIMRCLALIVIVTTSSLFAVQHNHIASSDRVAVVALTDTTIDNKSNVDVIKQVVDNKSEEKHVDHHTVKLFGIPLSVSSQFGITVFNFLLFVGILYFLLKNILLSSLRQQRKYLSDQLLKAEQDRYEAKRRLEEVDNKMLIMQHELDTIMEKATIDAKIEYDKIIESAKLEAEQIIIQARCDINNLKQKSENELCNIVSEMVIATTTKYLNEKLCGTLASSVLDASIEKMRSIK